ncbi:hypothetical protein ACP6JB_008640 [Aspergillus fumigatus]
MAENTYQHVRSRYGDIAKRTGTTIHDKEDDIALAFGYSAQDLHALPDKANLGLSCGNPVAHANIKEGETIVDLGSGGGIDVLLAARKVGPEGTAIGIDMTKDMINLAKKNAEAAGLSNTRFIEATITSIPLPDASVDCIISNCVINLVPSKDKPTVFQEIARLLKPGGRVAISDILARKELPAKIVNDMALYVGCIAGASQVAEYEEYLKRAGFKIVVAQQVLAKRYQLNMLRWISTNGLPHTRFMLSKTAASCRTGLKLLESATDHGAFDVQQFKLIE